MPLTMRMILATRTILRHARGRARRAVALCVALALFAGGLTGCSGLPDPTVENAKGRDQTTFIYDRNGKIITKLFAEQNRVDRRLDEIPVALRDAVVATEDKRFYEHRGIDPLGVLRAIFTNIGRGDAAQGGSTITQQYVKNAYFTQEKTFTRKIREALLAQEVEQRYAKPRILELYLNTIYFGHGAYGVESAAEAYFGKSVEELTTAESAMLAGVIRSPGRYSPYLHPESARQRRDLVLDLMLEQGYITKDVHDRASADDVKVAGLKPKGTKVAPYFIEYVKERLVSQFGAARVFRGGLRVHTTLDLRAQKIAERAVAERLDRKGDPSASLVAVRPGTGEIIAMVGGRDFASQQYNVAVSGRRQPGSAFKPFVLATALEQGISPEAMVSAAPVTVEMPNGPWTVSGDGGGGSRQRLRRATEHSVNAVFVRLIFDVGAEKTADTARRMGITTPITAVPAIALGGLKEGVSPLEMANAYATLAASGKRASAHAITRIEDARGANLFQAPTETERALEPTVAYLVTHILQGVIVRGTGTAANIGRPAAGKTGTTQEYRDAWFVGYTPDLATAVWVGYPEAQRSMDDVHGISVTGGSIPAGIWHDFMDRALAGTEERDFTRPDGLVEARACSTTGLLANEACPKPFGAIFLEGALPKVCDVHRPAPKAIVPNVVGLPREEAIGQIEAAGLRAVVSEERSSSTPPGSVIRQSPAGGSKVDENSRISIIVAADAASQPAATTIVAAKSGLVGEQVTFTVLVEEGRAISSATWFFGDGSRATGVSVTHAFDSPGRYPVTVDVTLDDGGSTSAVTSIAIKRTKR